MMYRTLFSVALLVGAATATAQTGEGAQQPADALGGPAIPGVCLFSREAIFANAAVGRAASARLQELARVAQAEIDGQRKPIETAAAALEERPNAEDARRDREILAARWQALQQQAAHSSREIEATRGKVLERIAAEAQPVIAQVYAQKNCGLLLDRNSVLGGNFANDLTAEVVRQLDTRLLTITFERERLPVQQADPAVMPASQG
jgi:Skp family chaperone for outer membrane proteins